MYPPDLVSDGPSSPPVTAHRLCRGSLHWSKWPFSPKRSRRLSVPTTARRSSPTTFSAGWRGDHQHHPGQPLENGLVESFYSCFRGECLNREQLWTLTEAHVVIEDSRLDDNSARPQSSLGLPVAPALRRPRSSNPLFRAASGVSPRVVKSTSLCYINQPSKLTLSLAPMPRFRYINYLKIGVEGRRTSISLGDWNSVT